MTDVAKVRRESMRWNLIATLDKARPYTTNEQFLLEVMRAIYPDVTPMEVRRELDYLADRQLVALDKQPAGTWFADLTRYCGKQADVGDTWKAGFRGSSAAYSARRSRVTCGFAQAAENHRPDRHPAICRGIGFWRTRGPGMGFLFGVIGWNNVEGRLLRL